MTSKFMVFTFLLFLFSTIGCDDSEDSSGLSNLCSKLETACTEADVFYYEACVEKIDLCEAHGLSEQNWDIDAVGVCNDTVTDCEGLVDCYADATYCDIASCNSVTVLPSDCPTGTTLANVTATDFDANTYYPCNSGFFSIGNGDGYSIAVCYLDHCLTKSELVEGLCM